MLQAGRAVPPRSPGPHAAAPPHLTATAPLTGCGLSPIPAAPGERLKRAGNKRAASRTCSAPGARKRGSVPAAESGGHAFGRSSPPRNKQARPYCKLRVRRSAPALGGGSTFLRHHWLLLAALRALPPLPPRARLHLLCEWRPRGGSCLGHHGMAHAPPVAPLLRFKRRALGGGATHGGDWPWGNCLARRAAPSLALPCNPLAVRSP